MRAGFRAFLLLLVLNGFPLLLFSQDTTRHVTIKPAFDFDQRFSFITDKRVNIWGARAGLLINEKFKIGSGIYFLNDRLRSTTVDTGDASLYSGKRDLYFATVYYEPFFFRFRYVELSLPIEAGFGKSVFHVYNRNSGELLQTDNRFFLPTGAGLSLSFKLPPIGRFKPTRWVGINFLAGYRYCVLENYFQTDYDGLFWSVSGAIFLDRVTDDCRQWKHARQAKKAMKKGTLPDQNR